MLSNRVGTVLPLQHHKNLCLCVLHLPPLSPHLSLPYFSFPSSISAFSLLTASAKNLAFHTLDGGGEVDVREIVRIYSLRCDGEVEGGGGITILIFTPPPYSPNPLLPFLPTHPSF
jgi:hypothetical protein